MPGLAGLRRVSDLLSMTLPAMGMSSVCWIVHILKGDHIPLNWSVFCLFHFQRQNCGPSEAAGVTCFHGENISLIICFKLIFWVAIVNMFKSDQLINKDMFLYHFSDGETPVREVTTQPSGRSGIPSKGQKTQIALWFY